MVVEQHTQLAEPWRDIPYFFVEHWGMFATAACVNPALSPAERDALVRRMELDGSYLIARTLDDAAAAHFSGWLAETLPRVWGPKADIARIALLVRCPPSLSVAPAHAQRRELARRFPCPILFHLHPHEDWQRWLRQHTHLFGPRIEMYPVQPAHDPWFLAGTP